jgi:predicted transcriptional regulator
MSVAAAGNEKSDRHGPLVGMGPLEAEVLACVWAREPAAASVREVYEELLEQRPIAYTTVMSVLQNLTKKGFLACDRSTASYHYRAARPAQQVRGEALENVVGVLYRGRTEVAAAQILGLEGELSPAQFEELRRYAGGLLAG